MEKKVLYQTPANKVIEVHTQGVLCQSNQYNSYGLRDLTGSDVEEDSDSWI